MEHQRRTGNAFCRPGLNAGSEFMEKIVIAGAGAFHFAPAILEDCFLRHRRQREIWFVDMDLDMAELTARAAQAIDRNMGGSSRFYYTTQLKKAIFGSRAVICCADFLEEACWKSEVDLLTQVGLYKQARLYGGLGGLMQTLRAVGFVGKIAREMKRSCPEGARLILCDSSFGGLHLARACEAAERFLGVPATGVSGVTGQTRKRLALYLGLTEQNVRLQVSGLYGLGFVSRMVDNAGRDLTARTVREMKKDSREELSAMLIDLYGAIPAGDRVMQYEQLADTPLSPKRTVIYSGVGAGDYEQRKRQLAMVAVHGVFDQEGMAAWKGIVRGQGQMDARPVALLEALDGRTEAEFDSLVMKNDGALPGISEGRWVQVPGRVKGGVLKGVRAPLPPELTQTLQQISLVNSLYAEAAAVGSREALRRGMEIDPALMGVDLLYAEDVVDEMMEAEAEYLPVFYGEPEE